MKTSHLFVALHALLCRSATNRWEVFILARHCWINREIRAYYCNIFVCVETRGNWLKINIFNIERLVKMGRTSGSSN